MKQGASSGIASFALLLALPACAAGTPASASCGEGERIVFACRSGTKHIALCESPAGGEQPGVLQYRIGRPGSPPEMVYPGAGDASPAFSTGIATLAGGGGAWVEFARPPYRYVVFSFWLQGSGETAGVAVERGGRRRATLRCRAGVRSELGRDYFAAARLPASERDFLP
ncbi:hypothetical protein [Thauera sinica]|uniref:Lipoprotein n=1 Tax=Thauera sinica TaxID=2665146 RepID=A0ABW1AS82_9RHOO|nr:hypothetical protein [Thauera sp. K11]ATE62193.1 hypothetical protein CCZ27_21425 [Thauera sp. K11]